ncbi:MULTISPECIES: hypothetical protein [unclassified Crossiella]|uniref:golvesin C-terminal-like domain-containing protein n=1 Tax=unclassified Crossiella TaxID=2620835 RepID=UPI001FFEFB9B|nr:MULTISPECIES: hypothetical protein [unclassified Crossiella]MCK2244617.1 hypothetical protein [Crossiella sp. S99.2]MCK2258396.1 hypothetical protein [Crossiella sp. S99.1]
MRRRRWQAPVVVLATVVATVPMGLAPPTAAAAPAAPAQAAVAEERRTELLGRDWRASRDRAVTTTGDQHGLHLLVAEESNGYRWRTAASLREPGLEADQWIGNACVTASGDRAVVAYAPRTFTNRAELFDRGAFTAVVDLRTGAVARLRARSSLAYFSPSCGAGEQAVLTQAGDEDLGRTRLLRVDAAKAAVLAPIEVPGQLTSAVPTEQGIVAADSGAVVRVDEKGHRHFLAATAGVPFKLAADGAGGVVYLERVGQDQVAARRVDQARRSVTTVESGGLTALDVTSGRGGQVFVTGAAKAKTVQGVQVLAVPAGAQPSTRGGLAVTSVKGETADPRARVPSRAPQAVTLSATSLRTGMAIEFRAQPEHLPPPEQPAAASPAATAAGDPHDPADTADRFCSVARNNPRDQAMQPRPRQVEWAVNQAVRGALMVQRPGNWKNLGMPGYQPQALFPPILLVEGTHVPAQVMLGIAAQESNLWQAGRYAVPGVTANPLIGNYYGIDYYNGDPADDWTIDFSKADCGYGVTQVTDGMRLAGRTKPGEVALPYQTQRAVALDFAANIAAGLRILQAKWNQVASAGLKVNNGDSAKLENWFFAVWAYNSGFYPNKGDGSPWGLGWLNNPANPKYPANRAPFLEYTYEDAKNPQRWPYPEKVLGWAGHPVEIIDTPGNLVAGFRPAWWNGDATTGPANRRAVKPPVNQFCDPSNQCHPERPRVTPNAPEVVGEPAGPCYHQNGAGQYDLKCWYHQSNTWKADCAYSCGNELLRFDPGYAYQEDVASYPPTCDLRGLPQGALIVDDVPDGTPSVRPDCARPWTNAGTFTLSYQNDASGRQPGKIDTHQIGGGFGGHFWFTHARTPGMEGGKLETKATWRLGQPRTGPMKIMVALPDHGAHTNLARYQITGADGPRVKVTAQPGAGNRWVSLGTYQFSGAHPAVTLSSVTEDGDGVRDIAFDAVAFVPINGTYREESVEAVAIFDENQNIDTPFPGSALGGIIKDRQTLFDWAFDTSSAIHRLPRCTSAPHSGCVPQNLGTFAEVWRDEVLAAGTDPVNHPPGRSIAGWIGFANTNLDRPTDNRRPAHFDNDNRYKLKSKTVVSFVADDTGKIVPGSESVRYENRSGITHLPKFLLNLVTDLNRAYGTAVPDLRYSMPDLLVHDGVWRTVDPLATGGMPGRAFHHIGIAPRLVDLDPAAGNGSECVQTLGTAGGMIAYRPMLSQSGPTTAMRNWMSTVDTNVRVPDPVKELVRQSYSTFFANDGVAGLGSSPFTQAAPIWQELSFLACADGIIRKAKPEVPVLTASFMPDQYLYHNGLAIDRDGNRVNGAAPVLKGDFQNFSSLPNDISDNAYRACGAAKPERTGNPWQISASPDPGINPTRAFFCRTHGIPADPAHSSNH